MATNRKATRQRIHQRIRKKVSGTAERPRLAVHFSAHHVYAQAIAEKLLAKKVENVVFDRGGYIFHGKVKALADAAREGGLKF
jgi:large subunit ribosomal protein L18